MDTVRRPDRVLFATPDDPPFIKDTGRSVQEVVALFVDFFETGVWAADGDGEWAVDWDRVSTDLIQLGLA